MKQLEEMDLQLGRLSFAMLDITTTLAKKNTV